MLVFPTTAGRDGWVAAGTATGQSPCLEFLGHNIRLLWSVPKEMGQPRLALLVLQSKFMEKSERRNREELCVCTAPGPDTSDGEALASLFP